MCRTRIRSQAPLQLTFSCKGHLRADGETITPAATCTFCLRMAPDSVRSCPRRDFPGSATRAWNSRRPHQLCVTDAMNRSSGVLTLIKA